MKQQHRVGSLHNCIDELQQQAHAQRLELEDAHHGYIESRREHFRQQEELSVKEKALRETQIRNFHEMGDMKRAQELRVDEFPVQKLRESHETKHRLTSQLQEMQKQMNSTKDSGDFQSGIESQWEIVSISQSTSSDSKFSFCAEPRYTFTTFDSSQNHFQGTRHSTTPGAAGSIPVHIGTGLPVARDEDLTRGTIPMPTCARRPSTMISSNTGGNSAEPYVWTATTADIGTAIR